MPYVRQEVRVLPGAEPYTCVAIEWTSEGALRIFAHFGKESGGLRIVHKAIDPESTTSDILRAISALCADLLTVSQLQEEVA